MGLYFSPDRFWHPWTGGAEHFWKSLFNGVGIISNWSLLLLETLKYFTRHLLQVLSASARFKHWHKSQTSEQLKRQNFHFHPSLLFSFNSAENWYIGQAGQSTAHKWLKIENLVWKPSDKNSPQSPSTPPTPSRLLLPGLSPPLCPPAGLQFGKVVGGPPFFYPSIPSPPPVLHSIHSYTTHLIPPIHQNCPLKVFDVHSFCHLSVQAACVDTCHFHCKIDILTPIVMMDWMKS